MGLGRLTYDYRSLTAGRFSMRAGFMLALLRRGDGRAGLPHSDPSRISPPRHGEHGEDKLTKELTNRIALGSVTPSCVAHKV